MLQTIKQEKKVLFYCFPLFFIYSILACYIIPRGALPYALMFLPIIVTCIAYEIIVERIKFKISDVLISFALLFCSVAYNVSRVKIANTIGLISLLLVCRHPQSLSRKKLYPFYLIALIGIVHKLLTIKHWSGISMIYISPNYSGFLMLLLLMFCFKNRYLLGIIFAIACSFIFLSRGYFLALSSFFVLLLNELTFSKLISQKVKNLFRKKVPIVLLILAMNIIVFSYGFYKVSNYNFKDVSDNLARTDVTRVTRFNDASNHGRWLSNQDTIEFLAEDHEVLLFGMTLEQKKQLYHFAHNSLLTILGDYGLIYTVIYFFALQRIIKRVHQPGNLKFIVAPVTHSLFLHNLLSDEYIIFFIFILTLKPQKGKWML